MKNWIAVLTCTVAAVAALTLSYANWPTKPIPDDAVADLVVIRKGERRLLLVAGGRFLKSYEISLGREPRGPKRREGDGRTPYGDYTIDGRNEQSAYHRSLRISYPNAYDRKRALERGEDPGSMIMIHGIRNGLGWLGRLHLMVDWTEGCIAVTNSEIEEIWKSVPDGTPVRIVE